MSVFRQSCRPTERRGRAPARTGTVLVETAVALPICLIMVLGILEYGRYVMVRNVLMNAAREGARFAAVHTADRVTADVQTVVQHFLANQNTQLGTFTIQVYATDRQGIKLPTIGWNDAPFGDGIAVQLGGDYRPVTPGILLLPNLIHVQVTAMATCEGN